MLMTEIVWYSKEDLMDLEEYIFDVSFPKGYEGLTYYDVWDSLKVIDFSYSRLLQDHAIFEKGQELFSHASMFEEPGLRYRYHIAVALKPPLDQVPLLINHEDPLVQIVLQWRLKRAI